MNRGTYLIAFSLRKESKNLLLKICSSLSNENRAENAKMMISLMNELFIGIRVSFSYLPLVIYANIEIKKIESFVKRAFIFTLSLLIYENRVLCNIFSPLKLVSISNYR